MTLLAGRAIRKSFGSRLILDGAELSVEPQARIGVVGPNGSGTSTLQARPELLVLDEPTTHLDIESVKVLEAAIEEFTGTVVAISHDRYFLDRVADCIVEVEGSVRAADGGYPAWLERKTTAAG